jgi:hypothetical protein
VPIILETRTIGSSGLIGAFVGAAFAGADGRFLVGIGQALMESGSPEETLLELRPPVRPRLFVDAVHAVRHMQRCCRRRDQRDH